MKSCININNETCTGCALCVTDCPRKALKIKDGKAKMRFPMCLECGHCVAICPTNSVSMDGYDMSEVVSKDSIVNTILPEVMLNNIKYRRSIRKYKDKQVEKEKVEQIIEAGRYSATGTNKQKVRYIVVQNPENSIEKLAINALHSMEQLPYGLSKDTIKQGFFFHNAPTVILVISEDIVDATIASTNMVSMADALGLGTLYVGFFVWASAISEDIRSYLKLEGNEKVVTALNVGYADVEYRRNMPRKHAKVEWM